MSRRGWCPSLYEPMQSGDGLLVRVKPPGGIVPAAAARALAAASERFGNGVVQLTNRGNLQFRGLSAPGLRRFADVVVGLGLASSEPSVERLRNVIVAPMDDAALVLAHRAGLILAEPAFAELDGKFGVVVDGGAHSVAGAPGDVALRIQAGHFGIAIGGLSAHCDDPVAALRSVITAMLGLGGRRMRDVSAALVFAAAGLQSSADRRVPAPPSVIGALPGAFGVGLAFGQTDADGVRALVSLAETGDATLLLTPWRAILLPGVCQTTLARDDLITDPKSPLIGIDACPGQPSCAQATVDTRADARLLAGLVRGLHVSGCAKGCAHPGVSMVTLVGEAGRYHVVRNGRAGDAPVRSGFSVAEIADYIRAEGLA